MQVIYLDNNASTPIDKDVADFMEPFLREFYGNPSSSHYYGTKARNVIEEARKSLADLLNCEPGEIIFTSGGTESNNLAIRGIAYALKEKGRHIITSAIEHPAVLEVCKALQKEGFEITYLGVDKYGIVDPAELSRSIKNSTILVSIMHANNETGSIQPIEEIAEILKRKGILFHCDAAQSIGKIETDVSKMGVDLLSVAGHKFYGPKGVGALFIAQGVHPEKIMHGANHERNLRPGTENILEIAGLGKAAEIAKNNFRENVAKMSASHDLLFNKIQKAFPDIILNGHPTKRLPNTLNISFPGVDAGTILSELIEVAASTGAACHADNIEISHVLEAMKVSPLVAMGSIRLSTGKQTTLEEAGKAADLLCRAAGKLSVNSTEKEEILLTDKIKLTKYSHGMGCACKVSPRLLEELLRDFPFPVHPDILVGAETSDDAAVYKINEDTAIVQTLDFFTPIIDDPYKFGAIAATNALSDIYAMGAKPLFALNIVAFPTHRLPLDVLRQILAGAREVAEEAGIPILGGHTIEDNEPKFGLAVTGIIHPDRIYKNSGAKPDDILILTKPLGTGIYSTALKKNALSKSSEEVLYSTMRKLNKKAAEVISAYPVSACTDVTGFGLLGHLKEMAAGSMLGVEIHSEKVPLLSEVMALARQQHIPGGTRNNMSYLEPHVLWPSSIDEEMKAILCDAQTSGGLLFTLNPQYENDVIRDLHASGMVQSVVIGRFLNDGTPGGMRVLK